jgi:UDP-N-acetylmuramate--alanine ligase
MDLSKPLRVHIVGIGGAGMSAIATILASMGHSVSGSDQQDSTVIDRLRAVGIGVAIGHAAANVAADVDAVAVSTAIRPDNVEVVAAQERGVPVVSRAEVLAALCAIKRTIAIAGTHGKTTTTSMLALILVEAGLRPSFLVGGQLNRVGSGVAWTDSEWFVVEADESDGTFLALQAEAVVVTSIEADHLDHYGSLGAIEAAFGQFLSGARLRVVSADDAGAARVAAAVSRSAPAATITYGRNEESTFRIVNAKLDRTTVSFSLEVDGTQLGVVALPVPGLHNAANAAAAIVTATQIGVPFDVAARALAGYAGVARRFQFRGERDGVTFVDDYAHNPGKVRAVLAAARAGGWSRVVAVFQPHLYSRTADLAAEFGHSFGDADVVVVTDVYGAREDPRPGVTGELIVNAIRASTPKTRVLWFPGRADLAARVLPLLHPGDLCLTLGAGDITSLADELLADELLADGPVADA